MALVVKDRVLETSNTNGTGTFTLAGAVNGFQAFSVIGIGNTTYYAITEETNNQWEVGIGTVGSGTLTRDTVLSSSNGGSKVDFADGLKQVFCDYPANKAVYLDASGNVSSLGTITSGVWNGSTIPVANGGTGVTTSSGANSVVLRDANVNINANAFNDGYTNTAALGTPIVLTVSSVRRFTITGSGGQTIKLPDATTLVNGEIFEFDNNQSSGAITVNNNSNTLVVSVPSGGLVRVNLLSNSIAAGSWDRHDYAPANVSWSTNTFDYAGSITSATWNGTAVAINRGGTGASTASTAFNNLSPLTTAGDTLYGGTSGAGTRLSIGTAGQVLTVNSGATAPQWSTPTTGTVTSVGGTGTVSGISLSGTVTSSGNLTLGGTLDLSSPPTIGNTAPNTGKFTTLESTDTGSFGTTSAQYIQAVGNATYPQIKAAGSGTDIPLVLQPKGTGALQAQLTDSTATGGNARGQYAVDFQTYRTAASQVASGNFSVIAGGATNKSTGSESFVGAGLGNTASGYTGGVVAGSGNTASGGNSGIVSGDSNTSSGGFSFIGAGAANTTAGYYNIVGGGYTNSGTSASAVTTQSGTMNGTTAVTLSGSNASIKVGQYITGTSIANDTYVAAISGTSLTLSKNASGSSTSTLSFYTPHGVVVGGGNNQATGSYSFIGGGGDAGTAANRNTASGDWSFVGGGVKNVASGLGSVVCGGGIFSAGSYFSNTASNIGSFVGGGTNNTANNVYSSVVGGLSNTASGYASFVYGGDTNTASGSYSSLLTGTRGTTRAINGNATFSSTNSISATTGITQASLIVLGRQTTDATSTILASDASAAGSTNQVILPNNSAYYFTGEVISGVTGGGNTKGWEIAGVIKRGADAASTTLVGSTVTSLYADAGAATWTIALAADTTNGGLKVTFTGQASTTIRTVCQIRTTEMTY
jgi:hypothetical protein